MKETVKHTPGPWRVGYKNLNVVSENEKIGGDAIVCDIRGWGYLTGNGHGALGLDPQEAASIQDANACLIAAAPDMLDALIMVRDADDDCKRDGLPSMPPLARAKIDSAIDKAEGRS